jgi:WhiB family redox-sensing transcriptional regulator
MEWLERALCIDEDPELFFPVGTTGPAIPQIAAAKQVCLRCPVRVTCLDWALDTSQDAGVWGGLDEEERRTIRRARRREAQPLAPTG